MIPPAPVPEIAFRRLVGVRRTLLDDELERRFTEEGYVSRPLLDATEVAALRSMFFERWPEGSGFHTDVERAGPDGRREVHELLAPTWERHLPRVLDDHRVFMASFLVKWPGPDSDLYVHQDTTYVDEDRYRSVAFWVALDDIGPEQDNGPLEVAPGSHRWADEYRGTNVVPWHRRHEERARAAMVPVRVSAGDLVVMDNRLIHWSPPNRSDRPRVVVAAAAVPAEAELLHAVGLGDGMVGLLRVDDDFYTRASPRQLMENPPPGPYVAVVPQLRRAPEGEVTPVGADDATRSEPPQGAGAGRVLGALLRRNHRSIERASAHRPGPVHGLEAVPWRPELEAAWPAIREEYDAVAARGIHPLPLDLLAGHDFAGDGAWDAFVLCHNGGWIEANVTRFPNTVAVLERLPALRQAMFSVLAPGAAIAPHRGANNGVLRTHLGVIVPDGPAGGVLEVGTCELRWEEGRAFTFDDSFVHAARSTSASPRVVLMVETDRPLPGGVGLVNRLAQRAFALHPQVRGGEARIAEVDAAVNPG